MSKKNLPLLPKNCPSLDRSPPKVPAHLEIPGKAPPETSLE